MYNVCTNPVYVYDCIAVLFLFKNCFLFDRVATNLENLEYSGISVNIENSGNSQGILGSLLEKL